MLMSTASVLANLHLPNTGLMGFWAIGVLHNEKRGVWKGTIFAILRARPVASPQPDF